MTERLHKRLVDGRSRDGADGMARFCVASGEPRPVQEMIRFVVGPSGAAVPDLKRRLPGRGVWITGTRQALQSAIARKAFARGFKRDVHAEADLVQLTERLLEQAVLEVLAICHKAGKVAIGFVKVEAALAERAVISLLHATEASCDGRRQLAGALRRRGDAGEILVVDTFTSGQLDLALGRSNVIHAALLAGPESLTFLARAARLDRFRAVPMPGTTGIENTHRKSAKAGLRGH
jgi:uncharacterized protein